MRPTVIELVGAPGAGKTTLIPAVMRGCGRSGLVPYTIVEAARPFSARAGVGRILDAVLPHRWRRAALWGVFRASRATRAAGFAIRHPDLLGYVVASTRRRPPGADARDRRVVHWYVRLAGSYRFLLARGRPDEALILDEGFVHRAVQLHASSVETPDAEQVAAYAARIPRPDLVIHVRASVAECERRVRARGAWDRFRDRDPEELSRFVANAHRATELIVEAVGRRGWPIAVVDNDGTEPDAAAAEAERIVARALRDHERTGARP